MTVVLCQFLKQEVRGRREVEACKRKVDLERGAVGETLGYKCHAPPPTPPPPHLLHTSTYLHPSPPKKRIF